MRHSSHTLVLNCLFRRSTGVKGRKSVNDAAIATEDGLMLGRIAAPLELTTEQRQELTALLRAHSTPWKLAERARIIMLAADGIGIGETARRLGIWRKTASRWRKRWQTADTSKTTAERLSDMPRSGVPGKFTPEQICAIVALACEDPQVSDIPISHWSQSEVARQAVKRGIVSSISHGSVGRFFKRISA
jgi:transposase